jgi:ribosomal protein L22
MRLNKKTTDKIVDAIKKGAYQDAAARNAGVNPSTFYRWMDKGSKEDGAEEYKEFYEAIENAKANAEVDAVMIINRAAVDGSWQAAAWWLERTRPKKFGRFDRNEVSGADGGPLRIDVSTEDLERKVALIISKRSKE